MPGKRRRRAWTVVCWHQLDLRDLEISYCDEAVLKQLDLLSAELLQVAPTLDLQWLELTPRR